MDAVEDAPSGKLLVSAGDEVTGGWATRQQERNDYGVEVIAKQLV